MRVATLRLKRIELACSWTGRIWTELERERETERERERSDTGLDEKIDYIALMHAPVMTVFAGYVG